MQNLPSEKRRKLAEDRTWDVDQIRVKSVPVVEWMSTITDAWVERSSQGAASWSTAFALSDEGLAKVGNAFRDSMKRSPPGLFVVVMNQVRWVGRINECGGTEVRIGEFSDEEEARFLAIIFLSQSLRATLGSDSSGKAVPKIPESLSYYGTPPAPSQNQKEVR
jgi:hypothetical protein